LALDPENNLNKASENIKQSSETSKEASKNIKEASKEIKEAAEVSIETSKTLKEASKGIEESVSNSNSGIKAVISEIKKNNESQENSEETSEENSKKIENLFAPIIKTIQEEKDFFFSLAERQKDWNDYRTVMEGDLIKLKFSELDAEKRMNDQKLKLLEEEEEKIRHMAENYEKTKDLYSPEQQKAMQESFIKAIKDIDSKKKEVKSRGEELETARYEKSFFGKIDKTIEKIGKSLSEAKEKTSLISQVLLGLFMFGLAIQKGLIDGNTIKKILSFVLDMLWRGVKSLVSMIANLTWMAIDGIFSWLESSLIGRIIKGLGVFAGQLNILKLFVKLPGPLMKISNILNIIFGSIGRVLGIMTKVFSFIPFFGKFFKVLDMVFTGIGSIAKLAPAAGQVAKAGGFFAKIFGFVGKFGGLAKGIPVLGQALTVVMLVVDAVRGFVRGFSGPDGSFLKGLRMALSQIISGLTFGLLDFELIDGFLENFYSTMWEFWSWVGNAIAKYYIMLWEIIKAPFVAIGEFFSDFWEIIWDSEKTISEKIYALFGSWWSAVKNMFGSIYTSIKEFVSGITDVFDPVFEFLDNIGANLRNIGVYIWNFIKKSQR